MNPLRKRPPEVEERIHRLFVTEGKSAAEVAAIMGGTETRNTVVALAHHRGWELQEGRAGSTGQRKSTKFAAAPRGRFWPAPETAVPYVDLAARSCRWPVGADHPSDMSLHLACGRATEGRYCAEHKAAAKGKGNV